MMQCCRFNPKWPVHTKSSQRDLENQESIVTTFRNSFASFTVQVTVNSVQRYIKSYEANDLRSPPDFVVCRTSRHEDTESRLLWVPYV